jgi:signal transduction histidine kinase
MDPGRRAELGLAPYLVGVNSLANILRERRDSLARRWIERVRAQLPSEHALDDEEVLDSLHLFLDEVISALAAERPLRTLGSSVAQAHGAQRQILQRDIADVVREYGLLFEAVVDECRAAGSGPFEPEEYARLAACLSRGAAEAVREFAELRALELRRQSWEHFAFLAHEIRGPLQTARISSRLLRSGNPGGRAVEVLDRSLAQLSETIDQALIDARLRGIDAGAALQTEPLDLCPLLAQSVDDARPDAEARRISLELEARRPLPMTGDARVLRSAVGNLIRNAVKFTRTGGKVAVRARERIIEIEDECGGLREGDEQRIFDAFRQTGEDRSGFGLGLAIARQGIEAHAGTLSVQNLPGRGCRFVVAFS